MRRLFMIVLHKSLKRSDDLMRSIKRNFDVNCKTISGVIECFNNKNLQGYMIKIFHSFNRDNDLAIWLYESLKDKNIQVAYSTVSNVDEFNNWVDKKKVNIKEYPIQAEIKSKIRQEVLDNVIKYYGLDEEIPMEKSISI